ncbi:MFS transporter [Umezawaea endophytica]|uniref:MFS transporter n=1 Tax=Umezawaea endophytica TaxID=1654476 RepID=A0A9X2VEW9_9PSEU|nr:MFS transporter [Umezawaea endophytica]MCS7475361.1 MFS transporter [Umezawaea endophytica]
MLQALRIRDFRLLWFARSVSLLGSWLLVVAIPAHVLHLTGSLAATGLTLAAEFLPPVLLGPIAGVLVDRWDRRRVMVLADVLRAVAIGLLLVVRDPGDVWLVYAALVAESVGTVCFRPAAQAHTPVVVGTGPALSGANSLNAVTDGVVRLVGGPAGGALLGVAGFHVLVWADVATYLLSAVAVLATARRTAGPRRRGGVRAVFVELGEGLVFLRGERTASALFVVNGVFLCANASLTALLVPFGVRQLGGTGGTGLVLSALGVGFLLGAPLVRVLVDRLPPGHLLGASLAGTAVGFVLLFGSASLGAALPSAVLVGAFGSLSLVVAQTLVQRVTPNPVLGRVGAVLFTGEAVATFVGALAGPVVAEATSVAAAALVACGATVFAAVLAVVLVPRSPMRVERPEPEAPSVR